MGIWTEWANRVRYFWQRGRIDRDLDAEIRFHLDARVDELVAGGLGEEDARRLALDEFGSQIRALEGSRAAWQFRWLEDLAADLRYAVRTFRRSPGFVITAVLSLAMGIGATSAIFTALDAVLWRPLAIADRDSLVLLTALPESFVGPLQRSGVFADVIGIASDGLSFTYDDRAERIVGEAVTPNYFHVLGVTPLLGQGFSPAVQRGDWAAEAVISYAFWQGRFAGDPGIIGRTIHLNTYPFTIVGVAPPAFHGLTRGVDEDVRIPMLPEGRALDQMRLISYAPSHGIGVAARLRPGTTMAQAETAANVQLQDFLRTTAVPRLREAGFRTVRLRSGGNGDDDVLEAFHPTLYVLLILAMTVLAIACVNVANLLLARATARARELAVRLSIGAGRLRLIRQMLAESLLLSLLGGLLGLGVASWSAGLLALFVPRGHLGLAIDLAIDARVLAFTAAVSILTALAFGLMPALQATRGDLAPALKADAAGAVGGRQSVGTRRLLVIAQVAFSIVLLLATGLFVRTLVDLRPSEYRADLQRVLLFTMKPQREIYTPARKQIVASELLRRVSQLPGVQSAALAEFGPLGSRSHTGTLEIPGHVLESALDWVTPGFFETIGLPRIAGRDFTDRDGPGAPLVAIINRSLARALFGDESPIGRTMTLRYDPPRIFTVVGVVADSHYYDVYRTPGPAAWFAFQVDTDLYMPTLHVRSAGAETAGTVTAIRGEFDRVDKGFPVFNIGTLEGRVEDSLSRERMIANISTAFGLFALLLAAIGLYGLLAYSVARRRREIGIRIALGSSSSTIVSLIAREGLLLVAIGSVTGLLIAFGFARMLASYLPGISSLDLGTVAACIVTMLAIGLGAVCVPAVRACRIDPLMALRQP